MRTPSQTVGPYYTIGLCRRPDNELVSGGVELTGELYDGQGGLIWDGMIELWDGEHWGRCGTHPSGTFRFVVPDDVPYLNVWVFARGLLRHQLTRVYLREPAGDPVLDALSPEQRATLVARSDRGAYRFDIRMQGDDATVFFEH
jgi:protocatechuate 3,4-dioxygenase, alpha subunit